MKKAALTWHSISWRHSRLMSVGGQRPWPELWRHRSTLVTTQVSLLPATPVVLTWEAHIHAGGMVLQPYCRNFIEPKHQSGWLVGVWHAYARDLSWANWGECKWCVCVCVYGYRVRKNRERENEVRYSLPLHHHPGMDSVGYLLVYVWVSWELWASPVDLSPATTLLTSAQSWVKSIVTSPQTESWWMTYHRIKSGKNNMH